MCIRDRVTPSAGRRSVTVGSPQVMVPVLSSATMRAVSYTHLDVYKRQAYACIKELMDAVDSYIPNPDREEDKPFLMPIEDVMTLSLIHI